MKVHVKFFGVSAQVAGRSEAVLEVEGGRVRDLLNLLDKLHGKRAAELASPDFFTRPTRYNLILVNGRDLSVVGGLDAELREGDEVVIVTFAHGG